MNNFVIIQRAHASIHIKGSDFSITAGSHKPYGIN